MRDGGSQYHKLLSFIQNQMDTHYEREIRDALFHLYDPDYAPSPMLRSLLCCDTEEGALAVQTAVMHAVEGLRLSDDAPPGSRARQVYELLHARFVQQLTLEQTGERLNLSYSSTWRLQRTAIHALARLVWEKANQAMPRVPPNLPETFGPQPEADDSSGAALSDWHAQARRELASLEACAPGAESDVADVVQGVLELQHVLFPGRPTTIEAGYVQPNLIAALHPTVLRQVLITAIGRLARFSLDGRITVFARLEEGDVKIALTGTLDSRENPTAADLVADVLPLQGESVEVHLEGGQAFLWIVLPSVGRLTVLAVDDNPDMVRFYRRCTEGTSYHIVQPAEGQGVCAAAQDLVPDVIVLDVVLPDTDGWEQLMRLRRDPLTCSVPIIVCTVVRERDLALSLGATLYLAKPVQAAEFIEALDRAVAQGPPAASRAPASN